MPSPIVASKVLKYQIAWQTLSGTFCKFRSSLLSMTPDPNSQLRNLRGKVLLSVLISQSSKSHSRLYILDILTFQDSGRSYGLTSNNDSYPKSIPNISECYMFTMIYDYSSCGSVRFVISDFSSFCLPVYICHRECEHHSSCADEK
jgi:hypothetical protein